MKGKLNLIGSINKVKCWYNLRKPYLLMLFLTLIIIVLSGCREANIGIEHKNNISKISNNSLNEEKEIIECNLDQECVPNSCCHPTGCVPISKAPNCSGIMCTQECRPNTLDCGQGYCRCIKGKCEAIFTE